MIGFAAAYKITGNAATSITGEGRINVMPYHSFSGLLILRGIHDGLSAPVFLLWGLVGSVSDLLGMGKLGESRLLRCDWQCPHEEIPTDALATHSQCFISTPSTIHHTPPSAEVGHVPRSTYPAIGRGSLQM